MASSLIVNAITTVGNEPLVDQSWDRIIQVRQTVQRAPVYYTPLASGAQDWYKTTGLYVTVTRKYPNSVMMVEATVHGSTAYFSYGVGLARDGTLIEEASGDNTDTPNSRKTWMSFINGRDENNTHYEIHSMNGKFLDTYLSDGKRDITYGLWIGGYSPSHPIAINRSIDAGTGTGAGNQSNSNSRNNPISSITVTEILQGSS